MIQNVVNFLFRCNHRRITRPFSPANRSKAAQGDTYVVCLDCGRQIAYDWEEMRLLKNSGHEEVRAKIAQA